MTATYDENLSENNFLLCLCRDHAVIHSKAIQESWIICIPRRGSYPHDLINEDDISAHILISDESHPGARGFQTLAGQRVELKNRVLTIDNGKQVKTSRLLFEETFYSDDLAKYRVWCIEQPLTTSSPPTDDVVTLENLADCMNFLFTSMTNKSLFKDLDYCIESFQQTHNLIDKTSPNLLLRDLVESLFLDCLEKTLNEPSIHDQTQSNPHSLRNIKISIESYVLYGLRNLLPVAVSTNTASEDAELNKTIKNLHELQLEDLEIRADVQVGISRGKMELSRLDSFATVLGKTGCLRRAIKYLSEGVETISTDDLLPILIFVVIRTGLPNWIAQLTFMKQFRFSSGDGNPNDEVGFLITSLEAALEHVKSGILSNGTEIWPSESESFKNHLDEETNKTTIINQLFNAVKDVDLEEIERILFTRPFKPSSNESICHPLCTCEKCEKNFTNSSLNRFPSVDSKDDRGRTALQIASTLGHVTVVEYFLIHGANPNEPDNEGTTALHLAASRGHQDTVLLLLHSDADPAKFDSRGNTPLHFAADNGHTSCIKAILYFSEQRRIPLDPSAANVVGDTPLHFASKWGFMPIVDILLEYQANPRAANRRGQTPLTVAHSSHLIRRLEATPVIETVVQVPFYRRPVPKIVSKDEKVDPDSEKSHITEKLLSAISEGDIRLACYYLGLDGPHTKLRVESELCHPLCICEKCVSNEEPVDDHSRGVTLGVNVTNSNGESPLHIACIHGLADLVQILLDAGANVNACTNYERRTPLHLACLNDRLKVVKMLLECGTSNVNAKDFNGNTPLHMAVKNGNLGIVELLIRHGANVQLRNFENLSALESFQEIVAKDVFSSLVYQNIFKALNKERGSSENLSSNGEESLD